MLFDHADDQVELIAASGKKGWQAAYRDAVMLKVAYSYGLRFNELRHLQTIDFAANPQARSSAKQASARSGSARHARAPRQTPQRPDGVRLDPGGDRRLARQRPAARSTALTCSPANAAGWSVNPPCCAGSGATATIWDCRGRSGPALAPALLCNAPDGRRMGS